MKSHFLIITCGLALTIFCLTPAQAANHSRTRFTPEMAARIVETARRYGLEPLLVLEIMRQESRFNTRATSYKRGRPCAHGLMQLTPPTAQRFGATDPYNPQEAIEAGCRYLRWLMKKYPDRIDLVLASYNAGEGAVEKYGRAIPPYPETRNYVRIILVNYSKAQQRAVGLESEEVGRAKRQARKTESTQQQLKRISFIPPLH